MISVVIPIFNEQENLPELYRRLADSMQLTGESWEAIFVDDGSRDESSAILRRLHSKHSNVKMLTLSRNFGHQPAVTAGIHVCGGDCVVLIDGDLQDPPEVIPKMVDCMESRRESGHGGAKIPTGRGRDARRWISIVFIPCSAKSATCRVHPMREFLD